MDLSVAAHWGDGHMWGGVGWMWLWMAPVWIAVIVTVVWLLRRTDAPRAGDEHQSARRLLAERYARGEIDTEEYHERLDALR